MIFTTVGCAYFSQDTEQLVNEKVDGKKGCESSLLPVLIPDQITITLSQKKDKKTWFYIGEDTSWEQPSVDIVLTKVSPPGVINLEFRQLKSMLGADALFINNTPIILTIAFFRSNS